jgi:hypothetical protein
MGRERAVALAHQVDLSRQSWPHQQFRPRLHCRRDAAALTPAQAPAWPRHLRTINVAVLAGDGLSVDHLIRINDLLDRIEELFRKKTKAC